MNFFTSIYSWFCDSTKAVFVLLNPIIDDEGQVLLGSMFPAIGITAAAISLLVAFAFYIWPINHPRFKAWWAWLIMLCLDLAINFGLAFAFLNHRITSIEGNQEIMDLISEDQALEKFVEEKISLPSSQWFDLALANVGVSLLFFIVASLILTWFSTSARFSPFRS